MSVGVHKPVLLNEVIEYLNPKPGDKIIDATFGAGGHTLALLEKIKPGGQILGIEIDRDFFQKSKEKFSKIRGITLVNDSYSNLVEIAERNNFLGADAILFDLGLSSWHLSQSGRGFSFLKNEPLDMRFSSRPDLIPAREIINLWPKEEIEKILREFGEEKFARSIAEKIIEARKIKPILTTSELVDVVKNGVPVWYQSASRTRIPRSRASGSLRGRHFATKTFQALRMAVNRELENIELGLRQIPRVLKRGGRAGVISFHSLEDRIVKNIFREFKEKGIGQILTKKPIQPSFEEKSQNPRSRSAKLRVIEILKL